MLRGDLLQGHTPVTTGNVGDTPPGAARGFRQRVPAQAGAGAGAWRWGDGQAGTQAVPSALR